MAHNIHNMAHNIYHMVLKYTKLHIVYTSTLSNDVILHRSRLVLGSLHEEHKLMRRCGFHSCSHNTDITYQNVGTHKWQL